MRTHFPISLAPALVMAMVTGAQPPAVAGDARDCIPGEAGGDTLSPVGFAMKMSLLDFLVIQRALMTMQDERAAPVLERLRVQLPGQAQPLHGIHR
jgi:hypothetical protein